ncbi:MAG: hypothetical protein VX438_07250, partial [Planctomycetota bacterium]|nr:hypothetical protein [Planctomycetota bacterium]
MSQKQQTETGPDPAVESNWSAFTKWVLSVIAIGHLSIVFTSPWALPQPSSQLARTVNDWTSPISNLLYMQHGYRFFAPDPGPSHLIVYEITQADGSVIKGTFPDRQVHRPRLLYHRFFMISEHFWGLGVASNRSSHELGQGLQKAEDYLRKNGFSWQADWIQQNRPRHELELLSSADIHRIVEDLKSQGKFHAAKTAQKNLEAQQAGMEILRK